MVENKDEIGNSIVFNQPWIPIMRISFKDNNEKYNESSIVRGVITINGQAAACGTDKGEIYVHSLETGKRILSHEKVGIKNYELGNGGLNDIKTDQSGNLLAACFSPGAISIYDLRAGIKKSGSLLGLTVMNLENAHEGACTCISVPNELLYQPIFSGGYDGYIRSWDLRKKGFFSQVLSHEAPVASLEQSNDKRVLSSASFDGKIRIWKSSDLKLLKTLSGPQGSNYSLHSIFSFNDEHLLCTGDSSSCIWKFGQEKTEKLNISWENSKKLQKDYSNNIYDNNHLPMLTGFSVIWRDQVFVPRINPATAPAGDASVYCLHTAKYLYSLTPISPSNAIITSISKHPDLNNNLIMTTSSLPEPSIVLWRLNEINS
ncbi:WD-40 repeat containing protein [Cryptosporidium hominis]|uniref:WD-40 repeat containing protein n=1 Tax=Cryptosporidium hominis TaxID=237895 RepID=A0ABX5BCB1_CRYHO|nr:WD-40 repeat protein [Cryptosporidium hominis TU502]PPS95067.1 WD-40 repeat containing protein [Cryptosporidium hominis]|eukprot:PPS95067.1 WD-40 repeat containing protein [Cryptosporidium hominis]